MTKDVEIIGHTFIFDFGPNAIYQLHFLDQEHLDVTVVADASYPKGTVNHFEISMTQLRPNLYMVTWVEPETSNSVTHVEDYERGMAFTNITDIASKQFWRLKGKIQPLK